MGVLELRECCVSWVSTQSTLAMNVFSKRFFNL